MSIGGSLFVHNAVEFDYCIREAVASLVPFCDEIVILDAQSTDDTLIILREIESKHDQVRVIEGANWECADDKTRLPMLANEAKSYLNTDWHFMLQADEVIHESSIPAILEFARIGEYDSCTVTRLNLWGDFDTYIRPGSAAQPCSWQVVRYGRLNLDAYGDAESFMHGYKHSEDLINEITIFHYGFLRNNMCNKVISMQSWFWGKGAQPDERYVKMREQGRFDPYSITSKSELIPIPMPHPKVMGKWIWERTHREVRI